MQWEALPRLFPAFESSERWLPVLREHARLLAAAEPAVRVTSVPFEEWPGRHYAEALELLRMVIEHCDGRAPGSVADIGSGGGFPGVVIAAVLPGAVVQLVEPLQKRARLLKEMAATLGLVNVHVAAVRAEDAGRGELRESAEVVTARAVAPLREILEYSAPLATANGLLAFPKGSGLEQELVDAEAAIAALGVSADGSVPMRAVVSETLRIAFFRKAGPTPAHYPRRAGMAAKRPL